FAAALFGARLNDGAGVADIAAAVRASPRPPGADITTADLLLDALVALDDDYATAIAPCRAALRRLTSDEVSPEERLRWLWLGCVIALEVWDDASAALLSDHSVQIA